MRKLIIIVGLVTIAFSFNTNATSAGLETEAPQIFAQIDDLIISAAEFQQIFNAAIRHKFYHGKVPEEEIIKFRRQVAEDIVTQTLVYNQALKQGIKADTKKINAGIDAYNLKYGSSPGWQEQREMVEPLLIERLQRQDLIEKMEAKVRQLPMPDDHQVEAYYQNHPDKFTEPERLWVSVILLKVPPAASSSLWQQATETAGQLKQRVEAGEDFAVLAREYSGHFSASLGGDLGYLHQGVLETDAQESVAGLTANQLSTPTRVLEGVALFKVNAVQPEKLKAFTEVKTRAGELLYREMQDEAWSSYVDQLKSMATIYVNEKIVTNDHHE